jgi:hypothetical protein
MRGLDSGFGPFDLLGIDHGQDATDQSVAGGDRHRAGP